MEFVLVMEATASSPLTGQVNADWLAAVSRATTVQLNRDVSPSWGGNYSVRAGAADQIAPGEIVFAIVDTLPDAPGAIAFHDVNGKAAPVAYLGLALCQTLADVSIAISHELCETAGDAGANLWADDTMGSEYARELCDAVESSFYDIDGVRVSDFVLPAFFATNSPGPYSYTESVGGPRVASAPFSTGLGGYQIKRGIFGQETQVNGHVKMHRAAKLDHWSSRAARRKLQKK
jgi:hypothetical protein